jgi:hypothetical protein
MQKEKITEIIHTLKAVYPNFYDKATQNTGTKKFYFLFFSTVITLNFFIGFYLTEKNPYSLLVPLTFFELDLPLADKRENAKVYLSDGSGNVFPSDRKVLLDKNDFRNSIQTLAIEISRPPYYETEENFSKKDLNVNLKKLPNIHYSIISIWKLNNDTIILDLRESSLTSEIEKMKVRIEKNTYEIKEEKDTDSGHLVDTKEKDESDKQELMKIKMDLLNSAFLALEKTIFDNFSDINKIEYRLDGVKKTYEKLQYDLTTEKLR